MDSEPSDLLRSSAKRPELVCRVLDSSPVLPNQEAEERGTG